MSDYTNKNTIFVFSIKCPMCSCDDATVAAPPTTDLVFLGAGLNTQKWLYSPKNGTGKPFHLCVLVCVGEHSCSYVLK